MRLIEGLALRRPRPSVATVTRQAVVAGSAQVQGDLAFDELGEDVAGIGLGAGEAVELGDNQDVPGAAGGHCLAQSGPGPVGAGQAVVDVDPVRLDTEAGQGLALGGEVLPGGGDPCVADLQSRHACECAVWRPCAGLLTGRVLRDCPFAGGEHELPPALGPGSASRKTVSLGHAEENRARRRKPTARVQELSASLADGLGSGMTSLAPLAGRVALVTGASRRFAIGAAIVCRLVADGATVLVHSWAPADGERSDPGGAEQLVDELRASGGSLTHVSADLANPDTPTQLVATARETFGRLDMVIANHARSIRQSLEELTAAEIDLSYAVNTRATLLLVQEFAAQFEAGPGGRVVLFTSGQYHGVMSGELPYIASKAALRELTPTLAAHLIPRGITVNCINPGPNNTGYDDAAAWARVAERNPGGRASTPQDTARLIGWLVSDEAEWVTGQVIASDGGWSTLGA